MKKLLIALCFLCVLSIQAQTEVEVTFIDGLAFENFTTTQLNAIATKEVGDTYLDITKGNLVYWDGNSFENLTGAGLSPGDQTKLNFITVTQAVDLDDIESKANSALQSYTETDPTVTADVIRDRLETLTGSNRLDASSIQNISASETDPVFNASEAASITATNKNNWNSAFGWGDHSTEGYLTTAEVPNYTAGTGLSLSGNEFSVDNPLTNGNKGDITVFDDGVTFTINQETIESGKILNGQVTPNKLDSDNSRTGGYIVGLNDSGNAFEYIDPSTFSGGTDDQDASEVTYDNTISGLTATEVQDAIDEVNDKDDSNIKDITFVSTPTSSYFSYTKGDNTGVNFTMNGEYIDYSDALGSFTNFTPSSNKIIGALEGIDTALGSISGGSGTPQTLSLGGTNNLDLTISGGNTVTLPSVSDSGQGMSVQSKTDVTETFDNSDVVSGGTAGNKRLLTKLSGTNEITLDGTIDIYGQPFVTFHDSDTGNTLIKKGVGTVFKMAGIGILDADGIYVSNYETPTIIALASNEYLISVSNYTEYTELSGTLNNAADPVNEVNGTANTTSVDGEITWSSQSSNVQSGSYALRATKTGGGDNDVSVGEVVLYGITNGQNVTVTFYANEDATQGANWQYRAAVANGWDVQTLSTISGTGYNYYQFTANATQDNPEIRFETSSVGDLGDILDVDVITWTVN